MRACGVSLAPLLDLVSQPCTVGCPGMPGSKLCQSWAAPAVLRVCPLPLPPLGPLRGVYYPPGCQTGGTRWALPPPGSALLSGRHGFLLLPTRQHLHCTCSLTFGESNAGDKLRSAHWGPVLQGTALVCSSRSVPTPGGDPHSPVEPAACSLGLVCPYPPGVCAPPSTGPIAEPPIWDSHFTEPEPVCVLVQPPGLHANRLTCLMCLHTWYHTYVSLRRLRLSQDRHGLWSFRVVVISFSSLHGHKHRSTPQNCAGTSLRGRRRDGFPFLGLSLARRCSPPSAVCTLWVSRMYRHWHGVCHCLHDMC